MWTTPWRSDPARPPVVLWQCANVGQTTAVSGAYANLYAGDPTHWHDARNEGIVTRNASRYDIFSIRVTEQLTPRNRVSFSQENQDRCQGSTLTENGEGCRARSGDWIAVGNATNSPEAFPGNHDLPYYVTQATWSSPVSNRPLFDADSRGSTTASQATARCRPMGSPT